MLVDLFRTDQRPEGLLAFEMLPAQGGAIRSFRPFTGGTGAAGLILGPGAMLNIPLASSPAGEGATIRPPAELRLYVRRLAHACSSCGGTETTSAVSFTACSQPADLP